MPKFIIDEDIPRSLTRSLQSLHYQCLEICTSEFRGASDEEIYNLAQTNQAVLLTGDLGFGNIQRFPLGEHHGIFIVHFPNELSNQEINRQILTALQNLTEKEFKGDLIILEPGRTRIRRK